MRLQPRLHPALLSLSLAQLEIAAQAESNTKTAELDAALKMMEQSRLAIWRVFEKTAA